jgi:hypothetical protein
MELTNKDFVTTVGEIINQAGTDALTIDKLAVRIGIDPAELSLFFKHDNDILILMLLSLENEMQLLIQSILVKNQLPEEEINGMFKKLYELFDLKPYFLSIIFAAELMKQDSGMQDILVRIRSAAETCLLQLVNQGKQQKTFYTGTKTSVLVKKILASFRMLMNDQWLGIKMIRDLEIQKSLNE